MKRPIYLLSLVLLAGFGLAGCSSDSRADEGDTARAEKKAAAGEQAVPVETARLERGPIESVLEFSTNLEAEEAVEVQAEAARRIVALAVEEGARVGRGQLLARLQDDEQQTRLAKVGAELDRAERESARQKRLFAEGLISEQAMNDATYELDRLKLDMEDSRRELSYTEVRAPISGTVTERRVSLGDHVTVNQPLFEIVDFDSIVARVFVPEKELPRLGRGLEARIVAPALGPEPIPGSLERVAPVVDPKSGTVEVTLDLPRHPALRPGMYVGVRLVVDTVPDALLVPKRALVYDDEETFVFRVREGGEGAEPTVERLALVPRLEDRDHVLPAGDGLAPGDRIVTAGQASLKDGARVRLLDPATEEATAAARVEEVGGAVDAGER